MKSLPLEFFDVTASGHPGIKQGCIVPDAQNEAEGKVCSNSFITQV